MCAARSSSRKTQARPILAPGILPALARERSSCGWQRRNAAASLRSRVFTFHSSEATRAEDAARLDEGEPEAAKRGAWTAEILHWSIPLDATLGFSTHGRERASGRKQA